MSATIHRWMGLSLRTRLTLSFVLLVIVLALSASAAASARRWLFSRQEAAIQQRVREADDRARIAEGKALIAETVLREKREQLAQATARAEAAEAALLAARNVTVRVKGEYDQTRNRNLSAVPADVAGLCAELARLGYGCAPVR
ncbi:MAG: hypothetical protein E6Q97_12235 [Desulfurellales bacterium]|nr:MAG: hypothetical protein E6Q97_12235 [Desulfurellales bacterium]